MKKESIATYPNNKQLYVFLKFSEEELLVGKLILDNRQIYFRYEEDFVRTGLNLSPIKLKFDTSIQVAPSNPFGGLFGVFNDSLPDGWGLLLLNRALEKQGLSLNDINALDQLVYIGDSGRGALIYRPAIVKEVAYEHQLDLDELKTAMDAVYRGTSETVIEELLSLGGSSGGARPKANVGYHPISNELIHGHKELPEGFEHWLIKFPSTQDPFDIGNIEFAYHKMALEAGIEMSECRLLKSAKGLDVFATKRFDRVDNRKLHMHSMAGLVHDNFRLSNVDYGHIIDAAFILEQSAQAREKVLRLAAFNIYSHNRDDHSKNFSWLMNEQGKWSFAPAYDLTYSSSGMGEHSTRVDGEGARPGRKQLLNLAEMFSIKQASKIIDEVQAAIEKWPNFAQECGVSKGAENRIQQSFLRLKDEEKF